MSLILTLEVCLGTKRTTASSSCSLHLCLLWSISICLFLSFCTPPFRSWLFPTIFLGLHSVLFPFCSHVHCPAPLPLFFFSSPHCVPLFSFPSTRLWWVLQLALLQYRLSMSSMLCQPPAPPGSGTLHTYQVLLPFHSVPRASWR